MFRTVKILLFILPMVFLNGCMYYLERGFGGVLDYSESWRKFGTSKSDVYAAMKSCGYTNIPAGQGVDNSNEADAARQECMFSKGFKNSDGWGGLCSDPEYRPTLNACKDAPLRPRWE